jgi:hypothetical protein
VKGRDTSKGKYLVDFEGKKFDELTAEELESFENEKEKFYEDQKRISKEREENITNRRGFGELTGGFDEMNSERLQWEAEALNDIENGITEESKNVKRVRNNVMKIVKEEMKARVLVRQSYDKRVTISEKEYGNNLGNS